MLRKFLLSVFAVALSSCGGGGSDSSGNAVTICPRDLNAKIINGNSCSESGSPIVKLTILSARGVQSICTGTVISSNKVLTAAHCFLTPNIVSVDIENGGTITSAKTIYVSSNFAQSPSALFNDVAIVEATGSLNLPALPILLSRSVEAGEKVGIAGFGIDEDGDLGDYKGGAMTVSNVTVNHIEARFGGSGSNACNGDSGGPATYTIGDRVAVVGITSSGIKTDCSSGDVTLFTNIQLETVLDFITSIEPAVGTL